jgi:hypothetical protein
MTSSTIGNSLRLGPLWVNTPLKQLVFIIKGLKSLDFLSLAKNFLSTHLCKIQTLDKAWMNPNFQESREIMHQSKQDYE